MRERLAGPFLRREIRCEMGNRVCVAFVRLLYRRMDIAVDVPKTYRPTVATPSNSIKQCNSNDLRNKTPFPRWQAGV